MNLTHSFVFLATALFIQANSWHGIVPLHSTRADVEKILGPPTPGSKAPYAASYRTKNERVFVLYSTGPCDADPSHGWNAPIGTVVSISVEPDTKPKFADLKLDESKYEKRPDPKVLRFTYYTSEDDGISIEVDTDEGVVTTYRYSPMSKDYHLRCPTPTDTSILGVVPHKIDEYSDVPFASERKRLENFAKQMLTYGTTQGYIIAYAGRQARVGEAQRIAKRAKKYLVNQGVYAGRIQLVDGGHRDKWTVELYVIPVGAIPPEAKPTVDPKKVQIIGNLKARNHHLSWPVQLRREPN